MDIVICTNSEVLEHKKGRGLYFWAMRRFPKRLLENEIEDDTQPCAKSPVDTYGKIYFAVKGFVVGYFEMIEVNEESNETIVWSGNSWTLLEKPILCKSFRGFRYRWFEAKP